MRTLASLILALTLAACASTSPKQSPDNVISAQFRAPDKSKKVVILPLKTDDADLQSGTDTLVRQLYASLSKAAFKPVVLQKDNYDQLWAEEVEAVGGLYDSKTGVFRKEAFARALSSLARRIAVDTNCSLVLAPSFVLKTATYGGETAEWDGVRRRQPQVGASDPTRWSGTTSGLSLELIALNGQGEFQFKTYGGLLLPYASDNFNEKFVVRKNMFTKPEDITEGVEVALRPIL